MRRVVYVAIGICAAVLLGVGDPAAVALRASPSVGFEPADIRFTIVIDPHPDNRVACLAWDSADGDAGQSCWEVDGDSARTTERRIRVGSGDYEAVLVVARVGGQQIQAKTQFRVLRSGPE